MSLRDEGSLIKEMNTTCPLFIDRIAVKTLRGLTESPDDGIYIYPLNKAVIQMLSHFGPAAIPELVDALLRLQQFV